MLAKVLPWVATILLNVVAPIVVYDALSARGVADVPALLLSGIPPVIELVATVAIARRVDEFSVFVLILLALSVLVALVSGDARLLLLRESAVTGLFGLVLLGSLLAPRPLMFYFGRRFATDGSRGQVAWWNGLWQYPGFRRTQYGITTMWGVTLLVEAVVRAVLTYRLSVAAMVVVNNVVPTVVTVVLVVATVVWGQVARRAGNARTAGAADAPSPDARTTDDAGTTDEAGDPQPV